MRYIPILFKPEMVAAILSGSKNQTRRLNELDSVNSRGVVLVHLKDYPQMDIPKPARKYDDREYYAFTQQNNNSVLYVVKCPYKKKDILWVKEPHFKFGEWVKNGITKTGRQKWKFKAVNGAGVKFTDKPPTHLESAKFRGLGWHKRSSLFMERADARLFLEITYVRVEKLQGISEADAQAEGVGFFEINGKKSYRNYSDIEHWFKSPINSFQSLWQSINGAESWKTNPWVWSVSFVIKK